MKRLLVRLLAIVGLVPAGQCRTLRRTVDELKGSLRSSKDHARQAMAQVKTLSLETKQQARLVDSLQRENKELQSFQDRLAAAEIELASAREQLMAVEVKLDILEGAANVLDTRMRSTVSREHSGRSASA